MFLGAEVGEWKGKASSDNYGVTVEACLFFWLGFLDSFCFVLFVLCFVLFVYCQQLAWCKVAR